MNEKASSVPGSVGPVEPVPQLPFLLAAAVLGAIAASRFLAIAAAPGEIDEAVFSGALIHYDLHEVSPQAPGYPVLIWCGRIVYSLTRDAYFSMVAVSTFFSVLLFPAFFVWSRRLVGTWAALGGAALGAVLPVVWVNGGRAFSDIPAAACFFLALALLPQDSENRPEEFALAALSGLLTAAGAGIRPQLGVAFLPLLGLVAVRLARRRMGTFFCFAAAAAGGTAVWLTWVVSKAHGWSAFLALLRERESFRSTAMAIGDLGEFSDWFVVRDFLFPWSAALIWSLAVAAIIKLVRKHDPGFRDLAFFLIPAFLSFWFWHSRAMIRYSVPFAIVLCVVAAKGLEIALKDPRRGLLATLALTALIGVWGFQAARMSALYLPPPAAALSALSSSANINRDVIIADDVFKAFLRTESWEGRLPVAWTIESDWSAKLREVRKNLIRLKDLTLEPDSTWSADQKWKVFADRSWAFDNLGNHRMQVVGLRNPSPPILGFGFGVREDVTGIPSFRWCGTSGWVQVSGSGGPTAALLQASRYLEGGPTMLTVRLLGRGPEPVFRQKIEPGRFSLLLLDMLADETTERVSNYEISCDRPTSLPQLPSISGVSRPGEGCFVFDDIAWSGSAAELWERVGMRWVLDLGGPKDQRADLRGFHDAEPATGDRASQRWTTEKASVLWVPQKGVQPRVLIVRCRAPYTYTVEVGVTIAGIPAGSFDAGPGNFSEAKLRLQDPATNLLAGNSPVRIEFTTPTYGSGGAGGLKDPRLFGIAIDRISLE